MMKNPDQPLAQGAASMQDSNSQLIGLLPQQVEESRRQYGSNRLYLHPKRTIRHIMVGIVTEPVFLLLLLTCALYFIIGDQSEAWMMVGAVFFVVAIELVQEFRSEKALTALRELSQPKATVVRAGEQQVIPVEEIVVGDMIVFSEGERIPADANLVVQHDLSIDEAILTGESLPVTKSMQPGQDQVFQGTIVSSGSGTALVRTVGDRTEFGKLGHSIESIETEQTPLQKQIDVFVRQMLMAGLAAFLFVLAINYVQSGEFLKALLFSLAFGLALIPEEIPVAFTTFMALGAYRMTRQRVLVKQPKTVESLGAATVICLDKTGTITENRMSVAEVFDFSGNDRVLEYAMWASEPEPFDPMEKAIHSAYGKAAKQDVRSAYQLTYEYPLAGKPPMMTHVYEGRDQEGKIIASKGAIERILPICVLPEDIKKAVVQKTTELAQQGYRILGVASSEWPGKEFPAEQDHFPWVFEGLVALHDPPKPNIRRVIEGFYKAGIDVKMITGDHIETALHIAGASGIRVGERVVTGEMVINMPEVELQETVKETNVFARMFPDAKLRIIKALQANGEIVAMTGDGVNDGPALKAAQVGVAMGRRGTEIAKAAASMVLLNDDLGDMIKAIKTGRRIYQNLRKAIRYIISIHLPIILTVLVPLMLGWPYPHMLLPIHVIFLELIMDPTCAVAFENEPAEPGLLQKPPRVRAGSLFTRSELLLSLVQGTMITVGVLAMYRYAIYLGKDEATTRSFVFATLLISNVFLTFINRSFEHTIGTTLFYRNRLIWGIAGASIVLTGIILYFPWLRGVFSLGALTVTEIAYCAVTAIISVGWMEFWKWGMRRGA